MRQKWAVFCIRYQRDSNQTRMKMRGGLSYLGNVSDLISLRFRPRAKYNNLRNGLRYCLLLAVDCYPAGAGQPNSLKSFQSFCFLKFNKLGLH